MKSNILDRKLVPILNGKQAKYNQKILEILYAQGPITRWELAKKLAEVLTKQTHPVYSVLIRKNGRVDNLLGKHYIDEEDDKLLLNAKGLLLIIGLNPDKRSNINLYYLQNIRDLENINVGDHGKVEFPGLEKVVNELKSLHGLDGWYKLCIEMGKAIELGLDLDRIPLNSLIIVVLSFKIAALLNPYFKY